MEVATLRLSKRLWFEIPLSSLTKGSVGDERVTVTTKDLAGGLMENQAKRFSVQHKQCALTIFAALLVGGRATEAAKNRRSLPPL